MKTWLKVVLIILVIAFISFLTFVYVGRKNVNQETVSPTFALTKEQLDGMTDKQLMAVWTNIQNTAAADNKTLLN